MNSVTAAVVNCLIATRAWIVDKTGSERGAAAVEYGLLVGLIAVAIIGALVGLGGGLNDLFGKATSAINEYS